MDVSGMKNDWWQVRTVGVLILAIGLGFLVAVFRKNLQPEIVIIGMLAAAGLTAIDV